MRIEWWKVTGIALLSCLAIVACDDDNNDDEEDNLQQVDKDFMTQAAYGNRAEIQFGELAETKGDHNIVQLYGAAMAEEHQEVLDDLEEIADDLDYDLPNALKDADDQKLDELTALTGSAFDNAYINTQVLAHAEAEAMFEAQVQHGKNRRLVEYARDILPKIRLHHSIADTIQAVMQDENSSGRIAKSPRKK